MLGCCRKALKFINEVLSQHVKSDDLHIIIVNNISRNKCTLLGENEEDFSSSSSSSSSNDDRNAKKIASKEMKIVMSEDSKDSTSEE